ncbi:hypothetical protein ACFW2Y_13475 [Streptomyces sp. NPDC058877]|uniref:hypothetical protein n=1 Tax=unclassified Streptomyces TaxID=2593676 RepID=UPI0036C5D0A9
MTGPEQGGDAGPDGRERGARGRERRRTAPTGRAAPGRPRGPLIGEYAPPYRRRSGRVAAVLLYRNGGHRVVWPDRTEDVNKPVFGSPYTVFEVRLGRHVTEFRLRLPAAGDGVFFDAVVKVQWTVTDPRLVVREQVEDVAELLHDELLDGLRRLSRRFRITDAERADEAVREELAAGRLGFGRDLGLWTRVHVFIDLDESVKAEVSRRDRAGVTMEADERVAEAERRRRAADRALIADRAREMEALFRRGDLAQIAHHMAMHPDKQWEIRTQLQRERREGRGDYLAVVDRLLDSGVLERHDIGEQAYQVLTYLRSRSGTPPGGAGDRPPAPSDGSDPRPRELTEGRPEQALPDGGVGHGDAPHEPRVHEPTRVESCAEREREPEGVRRRLRGHREDGHGRYEQHDPYEGADPYDRNGYDRPDPYDRNDRYDRNGYDRNDRYDRYDRDDPYDREGRDGAGRPPRRNGNARPARSGVDFDDWDDE